MWISHARLGAGSPQHEGREPSAHVRIDGAVLLRLSGTSADGVRYEAAVMTYVSPDARAFFLSKDTPGQKSLTLSFLGFLSTALFLMSFKPLGGTLTHRIFEVESLLVQGSTTGMLPCQAHGEARGPSLLL